MKNFGLTVSVEHGNVEKALRKFKKKVSNDGRLQEYRAKEEYIKPTTVRKVKKASAKKRWQKQLQSQSMPQKKY